MTDSIGPDATALTVLAAGASALARAGDLDTALAVIVEAGAAATGSAIAAVFAHDPELGTLELVLTLGIADEAVPGFAAEVVGNPEHPIHRAALDRHGSLGRTGSTGDGKVMTGADLPLVVSGGGGGVETCVGVLVYGWSGEHMVDTREETILVAVADMAAAAISMFHTSSMAAERIEWLERVALTDGLTGLANARTMGRVLELELARAQRQATPLSVIVFDVDDFRELNATAGARAGDDVLRSVAAVLSGSVRIVDTIARTGGDEFVIIAPGSAGDVVARRVLAGIAELDPGGGTAVSVSAGVARYPQDGIEGEVLLDAARVALAGATGPAEIMEAGGPT